jgi:hypothetical protein
MSFAVIVEDLCGAQVVGVSEMIAERDAVNGEYSFTFGIHKLRIILDRPRETSQTEVLGALPSVL